MSNDQAPLHIAVLLFPGFQALDAFGPLDALNMLAQTHALKLSLLSTSLTPVSTAISSSVFPSRPTASTGFGQSLVPTHTFSSPPKDVDMFLIPGGYGVRHPPDTEELVEYLRDAGPKAKYILTVCTGAGLAARAGLLDGRKATTNKMAWDRTLPLGPRTHWIAKARWVVDGNIWTAAGVSAGIDATLDWIGHVYGRDVATGIAARMEYAWHEDSTWDPFAEMQGSRDREPVEK